MSSNKQLLEFQNNKTLESKKATNSIDSVYNLNDLFDPPNQTSGSASCCCCQFNKLDITEEKVQALEGASTQHDMQSISEQTSEDSGLDEKLCACNKVTIEHMEGTSKTTSVSGSDLFEYNQKSSFSFGSNASFKLEIYNPFKETTKEALLKSESSKSVVMVELKIEPVSSLEQEIIELSDSEGDENDRQKHTAPSISSKSINNSQDIRSTTKKVFRNSSNHDTKSNSKSFSSDQNNNRNFKIKIYNSPQMEQCQPETPSNHKLEITTVQNYSESNIENAPNFENLLPNLDQIKKNGRCSVTINFKNNPPSTQNGESQYHLKSHIRDSTRNLFQIAKTTMQNIQSAIFKSLKSCSYLTFNPSNEHVIQKLDLEINESEKTKTLNNENKTTLEPAKPYQVPKQGLISPKITKKLSKIAKNKLVHLRRQLELHDLRVQVERKRLQILDLKLAREREEMLRESFIFEKYLSKTLQFKPSDDSDDI